MDKTVRVWDLHGKYCTHNFRGHNEGITTVRFLDDAHLLSVGLDNVVALWSLPSHSQVATYKDHLARITDLSVDSVQGEGMRFCTVSSDQMMFTYTAESSAQGLRSQALLLGEALVAVAANSARGMVAVVGESGRIRIFSGSKELAVIHASTVHGAGGRIRKLLWVNEDLLCSLGEDLTIGFWRLQGQDQYSLISDRVLAGHLGEVTSVRIVGNDHLAVTVNDENVRVLDKKNMNMEILVGHSEIVLCSAVYSGSAAYSGLLLATGAKDQTVRVWACKSRWQCVAVLSGHTGAVCGVAFSRGRNNTLLLASCGEDRTAKVWKLAEGGHAIWEEEEKEVLIKKADFSVIASTKKAANSVEFSPNDKTLAVACQDKTIVLIEIGDRKISCRLSGHRRGVSSVAFSPIERVLASSSADGTVKLWNLNNHQVLRTLEADMGSGLSIYNCAYLPNGQQVMGVCGDGTLRLWSIRTGECVWTEADVHEGKIWGFHLQANVEIVTGDSNGKIAIFMDNTEETKKEEKMKMADKIEKDTEISVLVNSNKFHQAAVLAMYLNRPGKFLEIIEDAGWAMSSTAVESVDLDSIVDEQLSTEEGCQRIISMCIRWLSNTRTAYLAQLITHRILSTRNISQFLLKIEGFNTFLEAATGYGVKHNSRVERLAQRLVYVEGLIKALHSIPLPDLDSAMGRKIKRRRL
ncbi:hypothetical protein C9890_0587 [Perkinsus sp. BL_2016]|nr:hypothetical protein C9890_0587 [Perkinsus sp. BL_2016]